MGEGERKTARQTKIYLLGKINDEDLKAYSSLKKVYDHIKNGIYKLPSYGTVAKVMREEKEYKFIKNDEVHILRLLILQ